MTLAFSSLASGSSGNCYMVASDTTTLLIDVGISGKQIISRLDAFGAKYSNPDAILITHEHSDHIQGLGVMSKKGISVFASEGTLSAIGKSCEENFNAFCTGECFSIGDINISSFALSHDAADPSGFSFEKDGKCISIITDTGYVTEACYKYMQRADILVLESNHDESMLRIGRYPWFLKQRILSNKGHLSNDAAAEALVKILKLDTLSGEAPKERKVFLAHLSKENNFPQMAIATMSNILENEGFCIGRDVFVQTLSRNEASLLYTL